MKSPTSSRSLKKSPPKKLPPKRDTAWAVSIVGLCVLTALVLWSGRMITELAYRLQLAKNNLQQVQAGVQECEPQTNFCPPQPEVATSSIHYVLDSGTYLSREWGEDEAKQDFWLVKEETVDSSASSVRKFVGSFDVVELGVQKNPFSIKRLPNGLYQFVATADYIETGSEVMGLIDSQTLNFITFTDSGDGQGIAVSTPEIPKALIAPHLGSDDCVTSSKAVVDRLDWNEEVLYQFRKPPTIKCSFNEMRGENYLEAFPAVEGLSVTRDLKSFVLRLQTGQALRLQFSGAKKPTVTVVQ